MKYIIYYILNKGTANEVVQTYPFDSFSDDQARKECDEFIQSKQFLFPSIKLEKLARTVPMVDVSSN